MGPSDRDEEINAHKVTAERWSLLTSAIEKLGSARTLDHVVDILRSTARRIAGADGIAIILSDN
ncbi:MAG: hybrid sensor histidine kinase/response regulator, partial [Burkholderiales bacterium]